MGSLENGKLIACSALSIEVNGTNAGGISGQAYKSDSERIGCYASGKISASTYAGGISGVARGKMIGCYSAGIEQLSSDKNNSVGTLIGRYIICLLYTSSLFSLLKNMQSNLWLKEPKQH